MSARGHAWLLVAVLLAVSVQAGLDVSSVEEDNVFDSEATMAKPVAVAETIDIRTEEHKPKVTKVVFVSDPTDEGITKEAALAIRRAVAELRRYLRVSTGHVASLQSHPQDGTEDTLQVVVAVQGSKVVRSLGLHLPPAHHKTLSPESFSIRVASGGVVACVGTTDQGVVPCAMRLVREMGVRVHLHGDSILPRTLEEAVEGIRGIKAVRAATPVFDIRGIQPFHDFAEGPDWWSADDYKHHISQLSKMGMNFIGLHTYPYNKNLGTGTNEPTVWVGLEADIGKGSKISPASAYPVSYQSTMRPEWGYTAVPTGGYPGGAHLLYETDCYSSPVQDEASCPYPTTAKARAAVFERTGDLLRDAFTYAHTTGIKTCVGSEIALLKPPPGNATAELYYEGVFRRVMQTYPIDYYWMWTPEGWEWDHTNSTSPLVTDAIDDIHAAIKAHAKVKAPFKLATCGWVLGPTGARALLDDAIPGDITLSSIDQLVGNQDVDPAYADIQKHDKWVIPWMEDDPGLTAPQLWVNRTIHHARDALKYGAEGLLGIHWRTRALAPQITAMSAFAWNSTVEVGDYWADWALHEFGNGELAAVFEGIDSNLTPRPVDWVGGPGRLMSKQGFCNYETAYSFVDSFARALPSGGAGPMSRFRYWLNTFRYMRALAQAECALWRLDDTLTTAQSLSDPVQRRVVAEMEALPARIEFAQTCDRILGYLMASVSNTGEMGTLTNIYSASIKVQLDRTEALLLPLLGAAKLPPAAHMDPNYRGAPRLVVTTPRSTVAAEETTLNVRVVVLASRIPGSATIRIRDPYAAEPSTTEQSVTLHPAVEGRGVFSATLDLGRIRASQGEFEYCVEAVIPDTSAVVAWPERMGQDEWHSVVHLSGRPAAVV